MSQISVLFVDDEEDIRTSFRVRFRQQFDIHLATDGVAALDILRRRNEINVVVTDIRMPTMSGLEMIKRAREVDPDMGFIVVSGHGDTDDVVDALRLGARNFIRKPYSFAELEEAITLESRRYLLILEERKRRQVEQATEQFMVGVQGMTYLLPNDLDWVNPFAFRLVAVMEAVGICDATRRSNIGLALIEIISNAIEHGNLAINGPEKRALKAMGEKAYRDELARRAAMEPYQHRKVKINATIDGQTAIVRIEDDGDGFDYNNLPDPTNPENLFLSSGRGILLACSFIDEVNFSGRGNVVTLVHHRPRSA